MDTKYFVLMKSILPWSKNCNKPAILVKIDGLNAQTFSVTDSCWQDDKDGNAYLDCIGQGENWSKCVEISKHKAEKIQRDFIKTRG